MFPLEHKSAAEQCACLLWSAKSAAQLDNGREFNNHVIASIVRDWPEYAEIVNGRPRHPQTHELVERGNRMIEAKLAYKFSETLWGARSE